MTRRFRFVTLVALTAALLTGASANAQGPGGGGFRGRGPGAAFGPLGGLPLRRLNLTEAQRTQVRQLAEQRRAETRTLLERLRTARQAQRQAVQAFPVDEGRIRAAVQELAQAQADLAVEHARFQGEIQALLTPGQQQRLQQLRAEREERLKQRLSNKR